MFLRNLFSRLKANMTKIIFGATDFQINFLQGIVLHGILFQGLKIQNQHKFMTDVLKLNYNLESLRFLCIYPTVFLFLKYLFQD